MVKPILNQKNPAIFLKKILSRQSGLSAIIKALIKKFPRSYLVGGAVRDFLLQRPFKDYDFVVEGVEKKELSDFLASLPGKLVDIQSRNFGVFKYRPPKSKMVIDIALPRLDIYGQYYLGHQDVKVLAHKDLTITDDLSRRDFTINSLAINLSTGELIDPFGGQEDLKSQTIRAVGNPFERLVKEDPTRMLRALRFVCQLNFSLEKDTFSVIKKHHSQITAKYSTIVEGVKKTLTRVSPEILATEFLKGFYANPALMIQLLDESGIYQSILSPQLKATWEGLKQTDQPPDYHAEGNVWNHTILALKNISLLAKNKLHLPPDASINLKLAVLLHDFGKVSTFVLKNNNYTYYNHPEVSANLSREFIRQLKLVSPFAKNDKLFVDTKKITFLVEKHMLPFNVKAEEIKERKVIKYFLTDEIRGQELLQLSYIDANSAVKSGHKPPNFHSILQFLQRINQVKQKLVTPINSVEKEILSAEMFQKKYYRLAKQTTIKTLFEKIVSSEILSQNDLDLINLFIAVLARTGSNQRAQSILTNIIAKKTPYPISGDQIRQLFLSNQKIFRSSLPSPIFSQIKQAIANQGGGKIIGEIKEKFLEDRLATPDFYFLVDKKSSQKKYNQLLVEKIITFYS